MATRPPEPEVPPADPAEPEPPPSPDPVIHRLVLVKGAARRVRRRRPYAANDP